MSTKTRKEPGKAIGMGHLFLLTLLAFPLAAQAAIITVTTTDDLPLTSIDPLTCSLREAIQAVIDTTAQDGCPAGSAEDSPSTGIDTIAFDLPLPATITLTAPLPGLDDIDDGVIISGPGSRLLTINGNNQFQVFRVFGAEVVTIEGLTIANGRASQNGGGILNRSGRLTVKNMRFTANSAAEDGGGISNEGVAATLVVLNSTFSGNTAFDFPDQEEEGGALVNIEGTVTIANSTFVGNNVPNTGGAIHNSELNGKLTLINSTITGNSAVESGGGVLVEKGGTVTLRNTVLAANGGGNCAIAATGGQIIDEGGNLDDSTSCNFGTNSLSSGVPGLDPLGLQNNGGTTDTVALTVASDAVDSGLNDVCAAAPVSNLDQLGGTRPIDGDGVNGAVCDIGAFELGSVPSTPPGPPSPPAPLASPPLPPGPAPLCSGRTATIYVQANGLIKGGPDDGIFYNGGLRGTSGRDVMVGTSGKDIILGFGGNDRICGLGGNDVLKGGTGKDRLFGGPGKDKLSGGPGSDRCDGGPGNDKFTSCERVLN